MNDSEEWAYKNNTEKTDSTFLVYIMKGEQSKWRMQSFAEKSSNLKH